MEESGREFGSFGRNMGQNMAYLWEYRAECETKTCAEFGMELVTISGILVEYWTF